MVIAVKTHNCTKFLTKHCTCLMVITDGGEPAKSRQVGRADTVSDDGPPKTDILAMSAR